jgi:hypothetical protein
MVNYAGDTDFTIMPVHINSVQPMAEALASGVSGVPAWWAGVQSVIMTAKSNLDSYSRSLHDHWKDVAGDSFQTRSTMADTSMMPWSDSAIPTSELTNLAVLIRDTKTNVDENKRLFDDAMKAGLPLQAVVYRDAAAVVMMRLDGEFSRVAGVIDGAVPKSTWNGPMASAGLQMPQPRSPGGNPAARTASTPVSSTTPPGTDPSAVVPSDTPADQQQATSPTGTTGDTPSSTGGPAGDTSTGPTPGGPAGDGPGLAGLPNMPPPPPMPTLPTGPGGVATLPPNTPTPLLPFVPTTPPGTTPPRTPVLPPPVTGVKGGTGLGNSVIGAGRGLGKPDLTGLDAGRGIHDGRPTGPAQAARQMTGRALPSVPDAPVPPAATASGGPPAAGSSSTPPPMMPPMGMGNSGTKPKPGTSTPALQGKSKPQNRLPGVPPKLRGRSGKVDPTSGLGSFGAPAAAAAGRRRRAEKLDQIDTVQLLDEELWAVDGPAAPNTTPTTKRRGFSGR